MQLSKNKRHRVCPLEKASRLEGRFRRLIHNPKKILSKHVKEGMAVLDFGCGPGFFSVEAAKMVGESGKVISVDLQQSMLNKLTYKIKGSELEDRIKLHKCEADSIGIKVSVDFFLAFYVIHEVMNKRKLFEQIITLLKPNGTIYIAEPMFRVTKNEFEDTIKMAKNIGFKVLSKPKILLSRSVVLKK